MPLQAQSIPCKLCPLGTLASLYKQKLFFDLGSSTWTQGAGGSSQNWFADVYESNGLEFVRMLMWEVAPQKPAELLAQVPAKYYHAYQYYNVPASADINDPKNPLNLMDRIAEKDDFVVFKLDIDTPSIENPLYRLLNSTERFYTKVDEFMFEHHVNFAHMRIIGAICLSFFQFCPGWGDGVELSISLGDSFRFFHSLRSKGGYFCLICELFCLFQVFVHTAGHNVFSPN